MRPLLALTILPMLTLSFSGIAQDNPDTFEKAVGEDYATLLETFVADGKLDETEAKNYLEAVFGYDEQLGAFLQTANFSQQLQTLSTANPASDNYLQQINRNLIALVPQEKRQTFEHSLQKQVVYQGGANELFSGKINISVLQLAADIFRAIKEEKAAKLKWEAAAQKLEAITPTLAKLNEIEKPYTKLKIVDEVDSAQNWVVNANPSVREVGAYRYTKNPTELENGALHISTKTQSSFFSTEKMAVFELDKTYRNLQSFDFSKDFLMHLYVKMDKKDDQYLTLEIGNGYRLTLQRKHSFGGGILVVNTPIAYAISDRYGVLTEKKVDSPKDRAVFDKEKGVAIMQMNKFQKTLTLPEGYKNNGINFDERIKLTVTKKGNLFSCKVNDVPVELTSEVSYFPNKYFLGFAVYTYVVTQKASVEIQKLELEHL